MSAFQEAKRLIVEHTDLARDALHIYVALALFLGACLLFGWKAREWKPWLVVLAAAVAGEAWDLATGLRSGSVNLPASVKDLWNTLLAPTVLMLFARHSGVFERPGPSGDEAQVADAAPGAERDLGDPRH